MTVKIKFVSNGNLLNVNKLRIKEVEGEKKEEILDTQVYDASCLPSNFKNGDKEAESLLVYGLKQFLQDRTSQITTKEHGDMAAGIKFEQFPELFAMLEEGVWRRAVTRTTKAKYTMELAQAIANIKGCTLPQAAAKLDTLAKEQIETLMQGDKVIEEMNKIKEEAEESQVDLDDLF